jgi:hypothetical protein
VGELALALPCFDHALRQTLHWLDRDTRQRFMNYRVGSHFPEALNRKVRNSHQHLFVGDLTHLVFISKADSVVARRQNNHVTDAILNYFL